MQKKMHPLVPTLMPLAVGIALGMAFLTDSPLRPAQSVLIGVAISITAIAASAKILQWHLLIYKTIVKVVSEDYNGKEKLQEC